MVGNRVEAGRWDYLTQAATSDGAASSDEARWVMPLRDRFAADGRSAGCGLLLVLAAVAAFGFAALGAVTVTQWLLP